MKAARNVALVVLLVALAAGCSRSAPAPLRDDDPISGSVAGGRGLLADISSGLTRATPELVASLEANLERHPDDVELRRTLLVIYTRNGDIEKAIGRETRLARRRAHIFWMIAHHPEISLEADGKFARGLSSIADPEGYQEGKSRWLAAAGKSDAEAIVIANAAAFLEDSDPALAIPLWKRAQRKDPANPLYVERLGREYARVLAATPQEATGANRAFTQEVSRDLERSTNATLLAAAGSALASSFGSRFAFSAPPDPGLVSLGRAYIDRALMIDGGSIAAHRARVSFQIAERRQRLQPLLEGATRVSDEEYRVVSTLPPQERMTASVMLAEQAYAQGNASDTRHDAPSRDRAWALARTYAADALTLAATRPGDPAAGASAYRGHIVLGLLGIRGGDRRQAVAQMLDAAQAPSGEELAYGPDPYSRVLVAYLLDAGERDTVVDFLYQAASLRLDQKTTMLADIDAIRANRLPATYRGLVAR